MKKIKISLSILMVLWIGIAQFSYGQSQDSEIFITVEEAPSYIGGQTAMYQFLSKNLKYPAEAMESNTQGTVYISFIVEVDGSINNAVIKRDIGKGCGDEALRVVKLMPKWSPGKQKGKPVRTSFVLPVSFKLS